MAVRFEKREYM